MKNNYGIYVDIDSLFDTRIATLYRHDPKLVENLLENDLYHKRDTDAFGNLKRSDFYELYNKRDESVLKESIRTEIITLIARILLEMEEKRIEMPFMQINQLHINTYPYKLSEEDKLEITEAFYIFLTQKLAVIDIVYIPPLLLNPTFIKEHYEIVFMYDWLDWVNLHKENLVNDNCMEIDFFLPALYTDDKIDRKAISEMKKEKENPFSSLEIFLSGMVKAKFINPALFSFAIPDNRKQTS